MLARRSLPDTFAAWNARWQAPFGPPWAEKTDFAERFHPDVAARGGPFAFQPNSVTRRFEYPCAYAFWWFDYYAAFSKYLHSNLPQVLQNERLVVFNLRA